MAAAGVTGQSRTGDLDVARSVKVVGVAEGVARSAATVVVRVGARSSWKSSSCQLFLVGIQDILTLNS